MSGLEMGPVGLNFCAAKNRSEVLTLLGWCFLLTPHLVQRNLTSQVSNVRNS